MFTRLPASFEATYSKSLLLWNVCSLHDSLLTCAFVPFFLSKEHQNEPSSPVCAFDEKCGELRTFESKDLAILATSQLLIVDAAVLVPIGEIFLSNW